MKNVGKLMSLGLFLTLGLWACQDQVVTPDVTDLELEAAFAKPPKDPKPPPDQMLMGFMPEPGLWIDERTLDISAGFQLVEKITGDYGEIGFEAADYELSLDFADELAQTDWGEHGAWCVSRECDRRGCEYTDDFNLAEYIHNASNLGGLVGRISGANDEWGFNYYTTVEGAAEDALNGHYWLQFCFGNCGVPDEGVYGEEAAEAGYPEAVGAQFTRFKNSPILLRKKPLSSTKRNDLWTHETRCGLWAPGVHRGVSYEILMRPAGG